MIFSIISAILLILAFPNFNHTSFVFVGFIPLFFAIHNKSPKKAFLISYVSGFLFYSGVLYWLYHVTVIGLIVLSLYLALYFGIFGGIFGFFAGLFRRREARGENSGKCVLYFLFPVFCASIWILLEYIQSRLFSGFGWALLGYSQYRNLPLIQIADFSGVYGVSFVVMLVNVFLWRIVRVVTGFEGQRVSLFYLLSSVGLIFALVYGYGFFRLAQEDGQRAVKISVIQGNIPQEAKWDPAAAPSIMDRYEAFSRIAALDKPHLIIWPETSFPGFLVSDKELRNEVLLLTEEIRTPLLLGANTEKGLDNFNSAVLISERGEILNRYDKIHLVPFGEFVPFSDRFPFLHNLIFGELGEFTPGEEFKIFTLASYNSNLNAKFAVLICFEDMFSEIARQFVRNGAEFLVVITNDAWYGKSGAAYQHAAGSVFRAIENRVPVIRCANTGYSCFIDKKGRIYDSVEKDGTHLFVTGYKTSEVNF